MCCIKMYWLIHCVNLRRLWCPVVSLKTSLDVAVKDFFFFLDVVDFYTQWTLSKADCPLLCGWAFSSQMKVLREKPEVPQERRDSASRLQQRNPAWIARLLACPTDFRSRQQYWLTWISGLLGCPVHFRLASPYNCVSQFLKIPFSFLLSLSYICIHTYTHAHIRP